MFNELKLSIKAFKKNWADYLAISFVFAMIVFLGILIGQVALGLLLAYVVIIIPAIISLKFCAYQAHEKPTVEYRSLKIGFLTFFKSIRVYFIVIFKPMLIGLLLGIFAYSFFFSSAVEIASDTIPNLIESLSNSETVYYTYEEMMKITDVKNLMTIGAIISFAFGYLVYFCIKLKRDFIPFVAFEMPINSKRAIAMNNSVLKKSQYFKFLVSNLIIILMLVLPVGLSWILKIVLETNEILSPTTINLLLTLFFCILAAPIIMLKQIHYVYAYKSYSKPFKEDFNNELKNVIKEMEELAKKIDQNNQN